VTGGAGAELGSIDPEQKNLRFHAPVPAKRKAAEAGLFTLA